MTTQLNVRGRWLCTLAPVVAVTLAVALGWLGAAATLRPGPPIPVTVPVEKGSSIWTFIGPVSAAAVAGSFALFGVILNRNLTDRHFLKKQEQDQLRAAQDLLEARYSDALDRVASGDRATRAHAAIRLAQLARTQWPGSPQGADAYPYFDFACSHLARMLLYETDPGIRETLNESFFFLSNLGHIAPQFRSEVVRSLVAANQQALSDFKAALARYRVTLGDSYNPQVDLVKVALLTRICRNVNIEVEMLADLMASSDTEAEYEALRWERQGLPDPQIGEGELLASIRAAKAPLVSTRDALCTALWSRPSPEDIPQSADDCVRWRLQSGVRLSNCFLAGAHLANLKLAGVDFYASYLHGAQFCTADLRAASFMLTHLEGADLTGADLSHGSLDGANLAGADFSNAKLTDARFAAVSFLGRCIQVPPNFRNSTWEDAKLDSFEPSLLQWMRIQASAGSSTPLPDDVAREGDAPVRSA